MARRDRRYATEPKRVLAAQNLAGDSSYDIEGMAPLMRATWTKHLFYMQLSVLHRCIQFEYS